MEDKLIQFVIDQSSGNSRLIYLGILLFILLKHLPEIQSFINSFKSTPLNNYLNPTDGSFTSLALKDLEEMRALKSNGLPAIERNKREKLLKLHYDLNGELTYKQVFCAHDYIFFDNEKPKIFIPMNRLLTYYFFMFCMVFMIALAILTLLYAHFYAPEHDLRLIIAFFVLFLFGIFFAHLVAPINIAKSINRKIKRFLSHF